MAHVLGDWRPKCEKLSDIKPPLVFAKCIYFVPQNFIFLSEIHVIIFRIIGDFDYWGTTTIWRLQKPRNIWSSGEKFISCWMRNRALSNRNIWRCLHHSLCSRRLQVNLFQSTSYIKFNYVSRLSLKSKNGKTYKGISVKDRFPK